MPNNSRMSAIPSTLAMSIEAHRPHDEQGTGENWARRRVDASGDGGAGAGVAEPDRARRVERLRRLAVLLDSSIKLPGVRFTIGIDPILGLFPGIGDLLSAGLAAYVVYEGHKLGATREQMARMIANVVIDTAAGFVPVVGDIFDFAFKANVRNLRVLGIDPRGMGVRVELGE